MMNIIYLLFALVISLLSVLGFISGYVHPSHCEWLSFFGLILLPVLGINLLLVIIGSFLRNKWSWLLLGSLLLNIGYVFAMFQTTITRKVQEGHKTIKVVSYNVNNFYTNQVHTLSSIASYMQGIDADIICLQEVAKEDSIMENLSFLPYAYLSESSPNYLKQALFSRYPLTNCRTILFPGSTNMAIRADIVIEGKTVRIFSNHLQTTSVNNYKTKVKEGIQDGDVFSQAAFSLSWQMKDNFLLRANQADAIRQQIDESPYPVIVCGDFNDTPASYAYHRIKGKLTDGFTDCGHGYGYTFRELRKLFRIDYIFYSPNLKGICYESPNLGCSDHKPVVWEGIF